MNRIFHLVNAVILAFGAVVLFFMVISANAAPSAAYPLNWTDNFDSPTLDSRWSWIRENPTYWSLTAEPGFLRITTEETFSETHNLLVQDAPESDYEIQTHLFFTPTENFQAAGLLVYQDDGNHLQLIRAYCDIPAPVCLNNGIYFDLIEGGNLVGSNYAMTTTVQGEAYLKLIREGAVFTGYVSNNGANWIEVGAHTLTITPTQIGLKVSNQTDNASEIPGDFDFFTWIIDRDQLLFLPLTMK